MPISLLVVGAGRAMTDLRSVAAVPQATGSPEHAAVATMKARLAEFGAASGVQDGVVARDYGRVFAGWRQNVIARERVAGRRTLQGYSDCLPPSAGRGRPWSR